MLIQVGGPATLVWLLTSSSEKGIVLWCSALRQEPETKRRGRSSPTWACVAVVAAFICLPAFLVYRSVRLALPLVPIGTLIRMVLGYPASLLRTLHQGSVWVSSVS